MNVVHFGERKGVNETEGVVQADITFHGQFIATGCCLFIGDRNIIWKLFSPQGSHCSLLLMDASVCGFRLHANNMPKVLNLVPQNLAITLLSFIQFQNNNQHWIPRVFPGLVMCTPPFKG